jgi:hypothetical protein
MNGEPIFYMILAMVVIWGTLIASIAFLARQPEVVSWPAGGPTDTEDLSMD